MPGDVEARASGFRDGQLVVHPDALASDCTVWFAYEPDRWEGLLAVRLDADRVRVSGVPFWVYDVNLGDEIRVVESAERALVATERVNESANRTFQSPSPPNTRRRSPTAWLPGSDRGSSGTRPAGLGSREPGMLRG